MTYEFVSYEQIGAVARICHNRPEKSNAENRKLLWELDQAIVRAGKDDSVRVIILGGKGKHFSAGHDLGAGPADFGMPAEGGVRNWAVENMYAFETEHYWDYCMHIRDVEKPTIAQVQGACIAGAFMVANMCDLLVASDDAFFADPVVMNLAALGAEVLIHPYVMGFRKAKEMLFTGERVSAQDALACGMANRVVPRAQLEEETLKLAQRIADAPPFTLKLMKRSINRAQDILGFKTAALAHHDTHMLAHKSDEAARQWAANTAAGGGVAASKAKSTEAKA